MMQYPTMQVAMQKACEISEGTMAAVLGLENKIVESTCKEINGVVVASIRIIFINDLLINVNLSLFNIDS